MKISSITIVGGGTAAWLTAAYISNNHPDLQVTIIDKEIGSTVGVGEGTLLRFPTFLEECGFDFTECFIEIGASFKNGILFKNWQDQKTDIWHPFFLNPLVESEDNKVFHLVDVWSNHQDLDFKQFGTGLYDISMSNNVVQEINSAYHVNCGQLVRYIQEKLIADRRVEFIKSEVTDFKTVDDCINELHLKNGKVVKSDLFVDCTGFKSFLNRNPKRKDLSNRLFCDTALAGHVPYLDRREEMKPYVISEAVECGWIWNIPVRDRIGSGIVFNRGITDIDAAAEIFSKYWNNRIKSKDLKPIKWDPFYNENMWHGNVISIGLSAGFIEPLESTGISLITESIYNFSMRIKDGFWTREDREIFNLKMISFFEESIDFVNMHYYNNNRTDPFWNHVRNTHQMNSKHRDYLEILKNDDKEFPHKGKDTSFFTASNWICWLIQMKEPVRPRGFVNKDNNRSLNCLQSWKKYQENLPTIQHLELVESINRKKYE